MKNWKDKCYRSCNLLQCLILFRKSAWLQNTDINHGYGLLAICFVNINWTILHFAMSYGMTLNGF